MKIKLLVADVTAVGAPEIVKRVFRGDFGWALFWPIQAVFVGRGPFCDVGAPS